MANHKKIKAKVKSYKSFWFYMLIFAKKINSKRLFKAIHKKPMMYTYLSINGRDWTKQTHFLQLNGTINAATPMKA